MDTGTFWDIIGQARADSGTDTPFNQALVSRLARLSLEQIIEFDELFGEVRGKIFRWDVWAAAYLIAGGCSDDSFTDFTAGVIAQGRDWYDKVAVSPDSLADHPAVTGAADQYAESVLFDELVNYAASYAYERVTGDADGLYEALAARGPAREQTPPDMGEDFDFDDDREMHRRLPRLARRYLAET